MVDHEGELELELEQEFSENALEDETTGEGEGWLGAIGNVVGSLLGEQEDESAYEDELEDELEFEGEGWLGAIGNVVGSLLGEQDESTFEGDSEDFLKKLGGFLNQAAPILRDAAKAAAPVVAKAIGGPAGAALGNLASSALSDGEFEDEFENALEDEAGHLEGHAEQGVVHEIVAHELTHNEAAAHVLAEAASQAHNEGEAEALAGAAAVTVLSPRDRRDLRTLLPGLVKGVADLTRILRKRRPTRLAVRAVPTIVRRTVKDLKRQAAKGKPITRKTAARTAAKQIGRVIASPKVCTAAVARNVKVSRAYKRPQRRMRGRRRVRG